MSRNTKNWDSAPNKIVKNTEKFLKIFLSILWLLPRVSYTCAKRYIIERKVADSTSHLWLLLSRTYIMFPLEHNTRSVSVDEPNQATWSLTVMFALTITLVATHKLLHSMNYTTNEFISLEMTCTQTWLFCVIAYPSLGPSLPLQSLGSITRARHSLRRHAAPQDILF